MDRHMKRDHRQTTAISSTSPADQDRSGLTPESERQPQQINEKTDDPHRLAREFIELEQTRKGIRCIYFWRGEFHLWNVSCYRPVKEKELRGKLVAHVRSQFERHAHEKAAQTKCDKKLTVQKVTKALIGNVFQALESLCLLESNVRQPSWLGRDPVLFNPDKVFATRNLLLDLPALIRGEARMISPTPEFFSPNSVDYEFDQEADCPKWLAFLESVFGTDEESVAALQEFFGYCLLPDTSQHKLAILIGPKRSGKGTIAHILRLVIGESNLATPTLDSLGRQFGLWPLLGKTLAIIGDARLSGRADGVAIVERLLSISGEDFQDVDRKSLQPLTGIRLPVRFFILTNELPNLTDASGAIMSRVLLIRMTRSFLGKEDRRLKEKLDSELPGILNWAIAGWQRLQERGCFEQPETGQELVDDLAAIASPVTGFATDCCLIGPEFSASLSDLFAAWKDWCEQHGRDHTGTEARFAKDLRAAFPTLTGSRPRINGSEQRGRVYSGIGIQQNTSGLGTGWDRSQSNARDTRFF
jgi:putative DNA primase/helicase